MNYQRVTEEERIHIYRWRQEGVSQNEIARRLARSAGTISRELCRNSGMKGYRPKQAHEKAQERSKRSGPRRFTSDIQTDVETRLAAGWTPEIISGRARIEGRPSVCKETIYKHIYRDAKSGGELWKHLPRAHRKRRRRCPRKEGRGRGRIPNQRRIDTRPSEVETREVVGHWEGDLINGAAHTGNLVTLVERKTRFVLVGRTDRKDAHEVLECMTGLFSSLPQSVCTGITFDNGKEFALHEELSLQTNMDVYFAYPYHSWERGSNENANGLIRRLHPKKSSFLDLGPTELGAIERYLNDRPRKCLGWNTPREMLNIHLKQAGCMGLRPKK